MWLERSSNAETAKKNLLSNSSLDTQYVLAGDEVQKAGYGSPYLDSRVPDLVISAEVGTLWADSFRFEDDGGLLPQDLNVPLLAYNPKVRAKSVDETVSNRQVATTLLQALGLPSAQLDGYTNKGTPNLLALFVNG